MRVMIALENRFYEGPSGLIYSNNVFDYSVWQRYLEVFDEVVIFARVGRVDREPEKAASSGPGVRFYRLPLYVGPAGYLRCRGRLLALAGQAWREADAFILRVPGTMSRLLWLVLRQRGIPYGVEVVGDGAESMETCGAHRLVKPVLKRLASRTQRLQCQGAAAAAYVSQGYLQQRYPPGGWSTFYSSIDLRDEDIIRDEQLAEKVQRVREAFEGKRRFVICHAGTMEARYKGQDVLIKAAALCLKGGIDLEVVLMGDGKFRAVYEGLAAELGIADRVRFLGNLPAGQAVRDEYDKADLLVFPSLTEGVPKAVIEAMARGLPCVASDVGGIPELIEKDLLARPGDAGDLAARMMKVLSDENEIARVARANLEKSKEYKRDVLTLRRIEFYERVRRISKQA